VARVNVEPGLFSDVRFKALVRKYADEDRALGLVVRFWLAAQKWWGEEGRQYIPDEEFQLGGWGDLAAVGLAEKRDAGWYARGSELRFAWYAEICDKGRAGVAARKLKRENQRVVPTGKPTGQPRGSKKAGNRQPVGQPSCYYNAENSEIDPFPGPSNDVPAPLSPMLIRAGIGPMKDPDASRGDDLRLEVGSRLLAGEKLPPVKPQGAAVWDAYASVYFSRYGAPPIRNAKMNRLCKTLVERLGVQPAVDVVRFYLIHDGRWYVQNTHDLSYCVKDAEALHTQMLTGRKVSSATAMEKDRAQGNIEAAQGAMDILMGRKDSILVTRD